MAQQVPNNQQTPSANRNIQQVQQALGQLGGQLPATINLTINNFDKLQKAQKGLLKQLLGDIPKWAKLPTAIATAVAAGKRSGQAFNSLVGATVGGAVAGGAAGMAIAGPLGAAAGAGIGALSGAIEKLMGIAAAAIPGGFDLITEAITEVAASFGQYLAPIIPVVAAMIKTFGDILLESLAPALEKLPEVIANVVIPLLKLYIRYMLLAASAMTAVITGITYLIEKITDMVATLAWASQAWFGTGEKTALAAEKASTSLKSFKDSMWDATKSLFAAAMDGDKISQKFDKNLVDQSRRMTRKVSDSIGQASFTGIADVWKKVQLEAFRNPHEVEMLQYQKAAAENTGKLVILNDKNNKLTEDVKPFAGR